jgi:sugar/nucleoside kinase (ribokinase family)
VTYRDLDAAIDAVEDGKRSGDVAVGFGGFAINAARAAVRDLPAGTVRVVTLVPWAEYPAVSRALPEGVVLDPILVGDDPSGRLPNSLVLSDPSRDLRSILKGSHDLHALLDLDRIPEGSLGASTVAAGRIPAEFARELLCRCRDRGSLFAWCGGADVPADVEADCPILLVDREEAQQILGVEAPEPEAETWELALELARRARVSGAIRVVTGGGKHPTAVVRNHWAYRECLEAVPVSVADPKHPKGAGDTFAARFLAAAFTDEPGRRRGKPDLAAALQHARFAAAEYVASGRHPTATEIEAAIAGRPDYRDGRVHAVQSRPVTWQQGPSAPRSILWSWPPLP